ncbi:MAG: hypothetical protein GX061_04025 [Eubacteriaceae bacterium]|nr:hypothetical protein [Eubacteriaceae bacterium]
MKTKRILSILVCLCMALALLPGTAAAANGRHLIIGTVDMVKYVQGSEDLLTTYYINGDTTLYTTAPANWNACLSWVGYEATLTLNNLFVSGEVKSNLPIGDLRIVLAEGSVNTITGIALNLTESIEYGMTVCGLYVAGDLTVTGDGTLTVNGGNITTASAPTNWHNQWMSSYGIYIEGDFSILGGALTANGGAVANGTSEDTHIYILSCGLYAGGDVSVANGTLTAMGGAVTNHGQLSDNYSSDIYSYGVCSDGGDITVSGTGALTGTGGTATSENTNEEKAWEILRSFGVMTIAVEDENKYGDVEVSDSGKLTATGGTILNDEGSGYSIGLCVEGLLSGDRQTTYGGNITISFQGEILAYGGGAGVENGASRGVYMAYGDLTVSGQAKLTSSGAAAGNGSYGILVEGNIMVEDSGIVIGSGELSAHSNGVYVLGKFDDTTYDYICDGQIIISDFGKLTGQSAEATYESYGAKAYGIRLSGTGELTGTAQAAVDSVGVYMKTAELTGGSFTASAAGKATDYQMWDDDDNEIPADPTFNLPSGGYAATYGPNADGTNTVTTASYSYDGAHKYLNIESSSGYSISGKVTDSDTGANLAGASVQLKDGGANVGGAVTTNTSGAYTISNVPAGTGYTIEVSKTGYAKGTIASFAVTSAAVTGKDITLTALSAYTMDFRSNTLKTWGNVANHNFSTTDADDPDGKWSWKHETMTLTLNGLQFATSADVGIYLPGGAKLVLNGESVIQAAEYGLRVGADDSVTVFGTGSASFTGTGDGGDGDDGTEGIRVGGVLTLESGTLIGNGDEYGIRANDGIIVNGGTLIGNSGASYSGSIGIYSRDGNVTIKGGTVTATSGAVPDDMDSIAIAGWDNTTSDYTPPVLSDYVGEYIATASVNANGTPEVDYNEADFEDYKYFHVEPVYSISGKVTDSDTGANLAGASVQLKDGGANVGGAVITDATGDYTIPSAPAGDYTIEVRITGYATGATASFTVAGENVTEKNITLSALENTISGITAGQIYTKGENVSFTANGAGTDITEPTEGDERWLPTEWETNPTGYFDTGFTQSFSTSQMTVGEHTLTVIFAQQIFNGEQWADTDQQPP